MFSLSLVWCLICFHSKSIILSPQHLFSFCFPWHSATPSSSTPYDLKLFLSLSPLVHNAFAMPSHNSLVLSHLSHVGAVFLPPNSLALNHFPTSSRIDHIHNSLILNALRRWHFPHLTHCVFSFFEALFCDATRNLLPRPRPPTRARSRDRDGRGDWYEGVGIGP